MTAADAAALLLHDLTGVEPAGIWSAPGRVNLIGEHTDYNEGFVLPFAIPQRTYAAVLPRDDGRIRVASTVEDAPFALPLDELESVFPHREDNGVPEWAAYPLGVAWALRIQGTDGPGVDIAIASDVPIGAGLSSSAAIEGAASGALDELWNAGLGGTALARVGRTAENDAVGAPTGIMDQMASMLGEPGSALFLDCRSLDAQLVPLDLQREGLTILVMDTGVKHAHATGGYRDRRAACERAAAAAGVPALRDLGVADLGRLADLVDETTFRRARHIVTENQRVLDTVETLRSRGPRAIGDLLVASHVSMRDDFEISVPELDAAVDTALAAGAIGARMTGGGFGGAAIALVGTDAVARVSDAVTRAFSDAGFAAPHLFTVTPAAGAHRDA